MENSADGKHFYLINELSSQVTHFFYHNGKMIEKDSVCTLPDDFTGYNICSDLHLTPDGAFIYASNRGHDSIVCYRINANGELSFVQRISSGGKTPRNFCIDPTGAYLLTGNQDSDTVAIFSFSQWFVKNVRNKICRIAGLHSNFYSRSLPSGIINRHGLDSNRKVI